jgi:hypothetical protein
LQALEQRRQLGRRGIRNEDGLAAGDIGIVAPDPPPRLDSPAEVSGTWDSLPQRGRPRAPSAEPVVAGVVMIPPVWKPSPRTSGLSNRFPYWGVFHAAV